MKLLAMKPGRKTLQLVLAAVAPLVAAQAAAPAPDLVAIPAGSFVAGSDETEREAAYGLDEAAYGHGVTRRQRWYAGERRRGTVATAAYAIARTAVTNAEYAAFVAATGHPAPNVDAATWRGYRLNHP